MLVEVYLKIQRFLMTNKVQKLLFILITILLGDIYLIYETNDIKFKKAKLQPLVISFETGIELKINSIKRDDYLKVIIVNDTLSWCCGYDSFDVLKKPENSFYGNYLNFVYISKKHNSDTLVTIDNKGSLRNYNIRSGPCFKKD